MRKLSHINASMSGNTDHPRREDKGSGGAAGSGSGSSSNNRNWTNEALHFSKGSVRLHEFRNAWERTVQDAKAKFIVVGNENNNATRSSSSSNYERNQQTSPVWGGLQTAFSSSFENAALDRAISMESIRELAKRTVQKPINEGLLKVGDSQFMEKFKQRAASSNVGNTADASAVTGGLRRSASKADDLNTDANKTMWPSSSSSASSGRLKRSDSKNDGGEEDANTQSLSGRSSPFSSSQDLSAIIEKNVMPKVKDITENITKNLQRPPEGWDVFKAVSSSKPKSSSGGASTPHNSSSNNSSKNKKFTFSGLSSRRSSQESLRSLSDNETDDNGGGDLQETAGEFDDVELREKFGKVSLQTTRRLLRKASSEALDTLKSKFTNPSSSGTETKGETNNEMVATTITTPLKTKEGEGEQFSIVGGSSGGKKQDVSTQTTSPHAPRSIKEPGRKVAIVTTATLPWMTGTAVNPLLRAAYLARRGLHEVTLVVPFIPVDEQKTLHPNNVFESPEQQETFVRNWVKERCGFDVPNLKLNFYPGRYATDKMSIIPVGDVSSHIKNSNDVAVLEEPEHLNWFHTGPRWSDTFEHVVGIIHTNYLDYVRLENHGKVKEKALGFVNSVVSRVHCHKVIKLSDAVQEFPRSCTMNVHGVSPVFLDVGASKAAAKRVQLMREDDELLDNVGLTNSEPQFASITSTTKASSSSSSLSAAKRKKKKDINNNNNETNENERSVFTKGAYFLGKVVWGKGYHELLDCVEKHNANAEYGQTCPISMDVYGNGEDLESVERTAMDKKLPLNFKGRLDHANPTVHDYKIFVNPSLSDVVATTTAEALAMGKFVVCAKHPSNEFFSSFPNCLTYGNQEEFSQCMKKAFDTEPKPLSAEDAYRLSWEAATDRFLDAAELGPEHKEKQPGLSKVSESVAASAFYALNNIEGVRQALGAGKNTHSIDAPEKLDSNWKPEKWEVAGLASSTKKK